VRHRLKDWNPIGRQGLGTEDKGVQDFGPHSIYHIPPFAGHKVWPSKSGAVQYSAVQGWVDFRQDPGAVVLEYSTAQQHYPLTENTLRMPRVS